MVPWGAVNKGRVFFGEDMMNADGLVGNYTGRHEAVLWFMKFKVFGAAGKTEILH